MRMNEHFGHFHAIPVRKVTFLSNCGRGLFLVHLGALDVKIFSLQDAPFNFFIFLNDLWSSTENSNIKHSWLNFFFFLTLPAHWKTNSIIQLFEERACQLFLFFFSPVMQYFSSLLIGDEKSSRLWVQSGGELLFRAMQYTWCVMWDIYGWIT